MRSAASNFCVGKR